MCNPESAESKIQPLIMGQSTFSAPSDMNFFTCDNENSNISASSRPPSSLGKCIQDVVSSHIEGSRIGKLVVEEMRNANNGRSKCQKGYFWNAQSDASHRQLSRSNKNPTQIITNQNKLTLIGAFIAQSSASQWNSSRTCSRSVRADWLGIKLGKCELNANRFAMSLCRSALVCAMKAPINAN